MFLDASVIVALLAQEPGWKTIADRMDECSGEFLVSPLSKFEAVLAFARSLDSYANNRGQALGEAEMLVNGMLVEIGAREVGITTEIGVLALMAARVYGKVVGHRASLNLGDCFSYACAKAERVPLLYKGNDFTHTDLG
ncbi:type II toxin-antitoxin system VapC family toxin [Rhizobium sp. G21]|uniref:type II toxin-antitoxin system VapC family toxin n=1 Tax=Rhizobium sp. G21 TaxID=2758439 RepID=UPI001601D8F0|nr:type II toxin-antitoxin system VapC family toxin [Rhizobium sp. G21]MBB1251111.1 type II toxin-antitoxin system VapC family toxin [Rhizobium sp. G21]